MLRALNNFLASFLIPSVIPCSSGGDTTKAIRVEGTLTLGDNMLTARSGHTATLLSDGSVLIAGGMSSNGNYFDAVEIYSPKQNHRHVYPHWADDNASQRTRRCASK